MHGATVFFFLKDAWCNRKSTLRLLCQNAR